MAKKIGQLGGDLLRAGQKISKIPSQNVRALAAETEKEMIRSQPKHVKQWDERQWRLKGPNQKGSQAYANLTGLGLVVISEHGSYRNPRGWTIYPKAFTRAGSKSNLGVSYVGRTRIDTVNRALAKGNISKKGRRLVSLGLIDRTSRRVLAFKGGSAHGKFSAYARHKRIPAGHFMAGAARRANERGGVIVAREVANVVGSFR